MEADLNGAIRLFTLASQYVRQGNLQGEVETQRNASLHRLTESEFLRESAWVILCSGFRESVVRRIFDFVSLCFCDWESASTISESGTLCVKSARGRFRNERKLQAILDIACRVQRTGFPAFKAAVIADPVGELRRLPYIGPITVWHLAKNLGLNVAKPDRHLARLAVRLRYRDAAQLCAAVAEASCEKTNVVDLILWRYLVDHPRERRDADPRQPPSDTLDSRSQHARFA